MTRRSLLLLRTPLALIGVGIVLTACSDTDGGTDAQAGERSSTAPASASPTGTPSATADFTLPDGVLALPVVQEGDEPPPLDAGRYQVPLNDTLAFEVDLPQGTTANSDGLYLETKYGILKVEAAGKEYGVPVDPCHVQNIEPVGPTVPDLVKAIDKKPIYRVSAPEPVTIDGANGTHLEIGIPPGYDSASCASSQVGLPGNPETSNNMPPGYVGDWWILDVDGQRVVAQQLCEEACGAGEREHLAETVKTITFTSTS